MPAKILYISYDGALEPLGQSQVLNYLEKLAQDYDIHFVSFEKKGDWQRADKRQILQKRIRSAGIHWSPLRYHKRPGGLSTFYDILIGTLLSCWIVLRYRIQIVHARSYVPSVTAIVLKRIFKVKYLFDMRGFWADERVDGGLWPANGRMYRLAKWFEKRFLLSADKVVSLTHAAVLEMKTFPYLQKQMPSFEVITTCTDLDLFRISLPKDSAELTSMPFTLGYVGSAGTWYLFDEALKCFKELIKQVPAAHMHILNRGEHDYINDRIASLGIPKHVVKIEDTNHEGVARAMQQMNAGIFIIKPAYSKVASAPTKLGEFLGCGVPCLANTNVGDMADILEGENVGVTLDDFSEEALQTGVKRLISLTNDPEIKTRCRKVAEKHFALLRGVNSYKKIYDDLLEV